MRTTLEVPIPDSPSPEQRAVNARAHLPFAVAVARIHLGALGLADADVREHVAAALAADCVTFTTLLAQLAPVAREETTRAILRDVLDVAELAWRACGSGQDSGWQGVLATAHALCGEW